MMPEAWKSQPTLKLQGNNSLLFICFLPDGRSVKRGRGFPRFLKTGTRADPGIKVRPYWKITWKQKGLEVCPCLASTRPCVQTSVLPKTKQSKSLEQGVHWEPVFLFCSVLFFFWHFYLSWSVNEKFYFLNHFCFRHKWTIHIHTNIVKRYIL
jgi:hypothetical protein